MSSIALRRSSVFLVLLATYSWKAKVLVRSSSSEKEKKKEQQQQQKTLQNQQKIHPREVCVSIFITERVGKMWLQRTVEWFVLEGTFQNHPIQSLFSEQGHLSPDQAAQSPAAKALWGVVY